MRIIKTVEDRRKEILDAAMRLFYEKGFSHTSITDISQSIGISQGLCYRYFKSKDEIFESAVNEYAESISSRILPILEDEKRTLKDLLFFFRTISEIENSDNDYYKFFHNSENNGVHEKIWLIICGKILPQVEKRMKNEVHNGNLVTEDPASIASFCVYGQLGIILNPSLSGLQRFEMIQKFLNEVITKFTTNKS
jgi:AcrR family transcriptional regulator